MPCTRNDAETNSKRQLGLLGDEAPTRCPTSCSLASERYDISTTTRSTIPHDRGSGERRPAGSESIPRDDVVLSGPECCHSREPRPVTLWPNRRRPPSVVFLKSYLKELKEQEAMATAQSSFSRVMVRSRKEFDEIDGRGVVLEHPTAGEHGSASSPPEATSAGVEESNDVIGQHAATEQPTPGELRSSASSPAAPSSALGEIRRSRETGSSGNASQQVSKYARIRGLPTPK